MTGILTITLGRVDLPGEEGAHMGAGKREVRVSRARTEVWQVPAHTEAVLCLVGSWQTE